MKRKIAIFTGNRSEYGILFPIIKAIKAHPQLDYFLLVSGSHLQSAYGNSIDEINADGVSIFRQLDCGIQTSTLASNARSIGNLILEMVSVIEETHFDFIVIYGDRFESLAAMIASTQCNIATAHIEGGDYTSGGALDDSVRHAMTKLAHLHFTTNEDAARRIQKMGEEPWRINNFGLPALDLIMAGDYTQPNELIQEFNLNIDKPILLFCQHAVATESDQVLSQILPSLSVLSYLAQQDFQIIITYPNNDAGGQIIIQNLEKLQGTPNIHLVKNLGRKHFQGMINIIGRIGTGAIVGNSSAGIKETPIFGSPVVNIGSRQEGRLRAENVIDVPYDENQILKAIIRCIDDENFRKLCKNCQNPYGSGNTGKKIAQILADIPVDKRLLQKKMTY